MWCARDERARVIMAWRGVIVRDCVCVHATDRPRKSLAISNKLTWINMPIVAGVRANVLPQKTPGPTRG